MVRTVNNHLSSILILRYHLLTDYKIQVALHTATHNIPMLFEKYENNYNDYYESALGFQNLINVIESVLQNSEDNYKSDIKDEVKNIDEVTNLYDNIYTIESELKSKLFPDTYLDYDFGIEMDAQYWEYKIEENIEKSEQYSSGYDDYFDHYSKDTRYVPYNQDAVIDDLFSKD